MSLTPIKNFIHFIFSKSHWSKTLILLAIIIIGCILIFKDCSITTNKIKIKTDTKIDMDKKPQPGGYDASKDFPPHP